MPKISSEKNNNPFFQYYMQAQKSIIESINSELGFIDSLTFSRKFIFVLFFIGFLINNKIIRNKKNQDLLSFKQFFNSLKKKTTFLNDLQTMVEKLNGSSINKILALSSTSLLLPSLNLELFSKEQLAFFIRFHLPEKSWEFLFEFISDNISSFENNLVILYENDQALINTYISSNNFVHSPKIFSKLTTRKEQGVFYTPETITNYLSRSTIFSFIADKFHVNEEVTIDGLLVQYNKEKLNELLKTINQLKLLDPACGTGNFLLATAQFLFDLKSAILLQLKIPFNPVQLKFSILTSNLYGVDLQDEALSLTKIRLLLWFLKDYDHSMILSQLEFLMIVLDLNFHCGNSLIGWLSEELPIKEEDYILNADIFDILKETINNLESRISNFFDLEILNRLNRIYFTISLLKTPQKLYTLFSVLSIIFNILQETLHSVKISTKFFEKLWDFYLQLKVILNQITSEKFFERFLLDNPQLRENDFDFNSLHPFHWNSNFNSILQDGGFDVIIGNPPYVENKKLRNKFEKNLYRYIYSSATKLYDLSILFLERAHKLLKEGGYFSFIITNKFLSSDYGESIRKLILNQTQIKEIIDVSQIPSFNAAATYPIIISSKKASGMLDINNLEHEFSIIPKLSGINQLLNSNLEKISFKQEDFYNLPKHILFLSKNFSLIKKINDNPNCQKLGRIVKFHYRPFGFTNWINALDYVSDSSISTKDLKFIGIRNIGKYSIDFNKKIHFVKKTFSQSYFHFKEEFTSVWQFLKQPKLLVKEISRNLTAAFDPGTFANVTGLYMVDAPVDLLKILILILNSDLIDKYYSSLFSSTHLAGGYLRYNSSYLKELPIILPNDKEKNNLMKNLAEWIIFLSQLEFLHNELPFIDINILKLLQEYFLNLSNLIIYEIYFHEEINSKLIAIVNNFVFKIKFDKWINIFFKSGNFTDKIFLSITKRNFIIIKKSYEQMLENQFLIKEINLIHSFVKVIFSNQ